MLRLRVKRRGNRPPDVALARKLALATAMKARLPPHWRIRASSQPLKGEWVESAADGEPRTLLSLHGGGHYVCSPQTHRSLTAALAAGAEARVFVPEYRLAPEHRFPAAVEDAVAAYRNLIASGARASRIVIVGDSAGGGLALAALLSLRDAGAPMPAGAVLFSPWTDLAATGESITRNDRSDAMFRGPRIAEGALICLGEASPTDPFASPLYADLRGLPPLFVQASDSEVLLDDSTRLAEKAARSGVSVSFRAWHRLPHVWQFFAPFLPEALAAASAFVRRVTP